MQRAELKQHETVRNRENFEVNIQIQSRARSHRKFHMQAKDAKISGICSLHLIHPGDNLSPTLLEGAVSRS